MLTVNGIKLWCNTYQCKFNKLQSNIHVFLVSPLNKQFGVVLANSNYDARHLLAKILCEDKKSVQKKERRRFCKEHATKHNHPYRSHTSHTTHTHTSLHNIHATIHNHLYTAVLLAEKSTLHQYHLGKAQLPTLQHFPAAFQSAISFQCCTHANVSLCTCTQRIQLVAG